MENLGENYLVMQRERSEHRITNARRAFIIKNIHCVAVRFGIICLSVCGGKADNGGKYGVGIL